MHTLYVSLSSRSKTTGGLAPMQNASTLNHVTSLNPLIITAYRMIALMYEVC